MYNYFSGLFNTGSTTNNNMSLYTSFSQLSSIKNGSYSMLLKKHYGELSKTGNTEKSVKADKTDYESLYESLKTKAGSDKKISAVDTKELASIKDKTEDLTMSSTALYTKGNKSAFASGKAEDAYAAIKSFVTDYNSLIEKAGKSKVSAVTKGTDNLIADVKTFENGLSKAGITIGKDGSLAIDDNKLKNTDVDTLKDVFNGSGSVAYKVAFKALSLGQTAANASSGTYSSAGTYSATSNSIFDNAF